MLETNEKIQGLIKEMGVIKKNQVEILELKNRDLNSKLSEWREHREESVDWKIKQQKSLDLNNRKNRLKKKKKAQAGVLNS